VSSTPATRDKAGGVEITFWTDSDAVCVQICDLDLLAAEPVNLFEAPSSGFY
jgi:hypothetical protein